MKNKIRNSNWLKLTLSAVVLSTLICLPEAASAQQFYENWESAQWGEWEQTGTQVSPPSSWTFEEGYNSVYSAQAKHHQTFGNWGGWTGIYHTIDFPASLLDLYYYFDRSGNLDYAHEKVVIHLSDDKKVEYWVDAYNSTIPQSTPSILYIDCTGGHTATWYNLQRNILDDIAGFSTGQVTAVEYGSNSRGNTGGAFYGLMRADNILLQAVEDSIPPIVEVISPNGGEEWLIGAEFEITWSDSDNIGIAGDSVYYSTDAGASWTPITYQSGDPQAYSWTIPNTPSDECKVKVVVFDWGDNSASDESDECFAIVPDSIPPTVTVTSPNGGESLPTGGWFSIQWEADDNVSVVGDTVFLSIDGGATWEVVIVQSGNPQSYNWNVPNSPSAECKIKVGVFDASGNVTEDESDEVFEIYYEPPPPVTYAVIIKQSTYNDPDWAAVAEALLNRYQGQLFVWNTSLFEVQNAVSLYHPTHIAYVCEALTASASFVQNSAWPFSRQLDADPYGDAIWGIITGYDAEDAMRLSTAPGFTVKTMLGGTNCCDVGYYPQGIATYEATYNQYTVKVTDSLGTATYNNGPTDRTEWLMTMINEGIEMFNFDPVDIFMTSGHGNHDLWQLHYPTSGLEGYFRSSSGQLYGDPYSGPNINANSLNPKIYMALGNCYVGKIQSMSSMAPAWIHTGGALLMTGYTIGEGSNCCQHGGTKAFFHRQGLYTWPEAFFLANQNIKFDILNSTPGANPNDLNGSALYGDPALDARLDVSSGIIIGSMYSENIEVSPGTAVDTVRITVTMLMEGSPGYTSKWGNRHPTILLPFPAYNVNVLYHTCLDVVVMDNFALMYVWHQGMGTYPAGTTWELMFTCSPVGAGELTVELTPYNTPIIIPEAGGSFDFNIEIDNTFVISQTFDVWTYATLPTGGTVGPIILAENLTIPGNTTVDRDRTQIVPERAPGGTYTYHACVGTYPNVITSSDSFNFEKLGDGEGGEWTVDDWACLGEGFDEYSPAMDELVPDNYSISAPYPNPFNLETVFSFIIPKSEKVSFKVYNLLGQEVRTLFEGVKASGEHTLKWDGRNNQGCPLASGIYIYRLKAGGKVFAGKSVLMK